MGASPKEQPLECPMPLSDTAIKKAKPGDKPVKLSDGKGLYLRVNPVGSRLLRWTTGVRGCWFARGAWVLVCERGVGCGAGRRQVVAPGKEVAGEMAGLGRPGMSIR